MDVSIITLVILSFCILFLVLFYKSKRDPKLVAQEEARLQEIYAKMSDEELIRIGIKSEKQVKQEKLDAIYAQLSEDEVAVIKKEIADSNKEKELEERRKEMVKYNSDLISNPAFSSLSCNIYSKR